MQFKRSQSAWHSACLKTVLSQDLAQQAQTFLQQQLRHSSVAHCEQLSVIILKRQETTDSLECDLGIFYHGLNSGCNCSENPADHLQNEYCELQLSISKQNHATAVLSII